MRVRDFGPLSVDINVRTRLSALVGVVPWYNEQQLDLSASPEAFAVNCVVMAEDHDCGDDPEILFLRRASANGTHVGKWNNVAGFLADPNGSVVKSILEELGEEIGATERDVVRLGFAKPIEVKRTGATGEPQTLLVVPAVVVLRSAFVEELNAEHDAAEWIRQSQLVQFDRVPVVDQVVETAKSLIVEMDRRDVLRQERRALNDARLAKVAEAEEFARSLDKDHVVTVQVDGDLCTTSELCVELAPEVFIVDSDSWVTEVVDPVTGKHELNGTVVINHSSILRAAEAARECPSEAIYIELSPLRPVN